MTRATRRCSCMTEPPWRDLEELIRLSRNLRPARHRHGARHAKSLRGEAQRGPVCRARDGGRAAVAICASFFNKEAAGNAGGISVPSVAGRARAEFGLLGDDDFTLKVSPDGSAWQDAFSGRCRNRRRQLSARCGTGRNRDLSTPTAHGRNPPGRRASSSRRSAQAAVAAPVRSAMIPHHVTVAGEAARAAVARITFCWRARSVRASPSPSVRAVAGAAGVFDNADAEGARWG